MSDVAVSAPEFAIIGVTAEPFAATPLLRFALEVTDDVPPGVVVAPGVRRLEDARSGRTVNALTSQRLTDQGGGSTFYDTAVDVRAAAPA